MSHREILTVTRQQNFTQTTLTYLPADWLAINEAGPNHLEGIVAARWRKVFALKPNAICS